MEEINATFPLWLEYSGLPEFINTKIRGGAWSVFKKIVEEDCAKNLKPGIVEISVEQLSLRTGLQQEVIERIAEKLRQKKIMVTFLPDNPFETALFQVRTPINTPVEPKEIRSKHRDVFPSGRDFFRYYDAPLEISDRDETLKEIVDLYFNCLGLKMNTFILDELNLIRHRFPLTKIRQIFDRAKRHNIPSLKWVIKELFREKKHGDAGKRK